MTYAAPKTKINDARKATDAALRYLSLRAYGERELYDKLLLRCDERSAAAAMANLRGADLLNDESFALEKAKGMAGRGKSPMEIRLKLHSLGIDRELAARVIEGLCINGAAAARRLVEKHYREKLDAGRRREVMAALARRGFSHGDIVKALDAILDVEEGPV